MSYLCMFQQSRDVVGDKTEFNQESELEFSGTFKGLLALELQWRLHSQIS